MILPAILTEAKTRKILAWVAVVVVVGGGYFFINRWLETKNLPPDFIEAREQGAFVAREIVFLTNQSLAGLEQIAGLDENKRYEAALNRVEKEMERNSQARSKALLLSSHLGTMAAYLPEVEPDRARAIATEAIGNEVSLVNRLLTLHGLLNELFELLRRKFIGETENNDGLVRNLIADINAEIKMINNLNLKFNELMDDFDSIYGDLDVDN